MQKRIYNCLLTSALYVKSVNPSLTKDVATYRHNTSDRVNNDIVDNTDSHKVKC